MEQLQLLAWQGASVLLLFQAESYVLVLEAASVLEFLELPHRPQTMVHCSALLALISQEMIHELPVQRGFELLLFLL